MLPGLLIGFTLSFQAPEVPADLPFVVYPGGDGPGRGREIVFVTGDEEYRSEESLPQLAKILSVRHGFRATVLFAIDRETGEIDPDTQDNIPGLEALDTADLMVLFTRFRDLPDEQMRWIVRYVESGRPIVGLRTATHAFRFERHTTYRRYDYRSREWDGGFGRQVLGETWIAHHGRHGSQSTRGLLERSAGPHPILRGIADGDVWDPADVYAVRLPLPDDCRTLLRGQVLAGMRKDDGPATPVSGEPASDPNDPMMPIAWVRTRTAGTETTTRIFATTLGSSQAFEQEGTRRLLVNACYWAVGLEAEIDPGLDVELVGEFAPRPFGFGKFERGLRPRDHTLNR